MMPNVIMLSTHKPNEMKKYSRKLPVKTILPFLIVHPLHMVFRKKGAGPCDHHTEKR